MHLPVLQKEVIEYLDPKPNENFIDCTLGEGGHTLAILERTSPSGKVLGIDQDQEILENTRHKIENTEYGDRLILVCDNFVNLKEIAEKPTVRTQEKFEPVSGILFDLGISSWHLEESGRGFSFQKEEPLDMRCDKNSNLTAEKIVNEYSEKEIERILKEYGEEKFSRQISKKIIEFRKIKPLKTTLQLIEIFKKSVPVWYQHKKIHFATRAFQALRIAVNNELTNLEKALPQTLDILEYGGRLVVISFHSLEDRIVKNFLKEKSKENLIKILTKKPIAPSEEEIKANIHSRSAKLRAAIKI